ncbi:amino acid ABC transporter substrate-binding protein, partial [Pseudomonas aeruginosa]|nr:amino acid ABC transporter substrate-binding protein [Pseudomonas aeruginosa]
MTIMKGTWLVLAAVCLGASATAEAGATLDAVKRKVYVQCGVSDGLPGFSYADAKGRFKWLDVDICRALAAALFGDAEKVRFAPL